jgi:hypothetical protein
LRRKRTWFAAVRECAASLDAADRQTVGEFGRGVGGLAQIAASHDAVHRLRFHCADRQTARSILRDLHQSRNGSDG